MLDIKVDFLERIKLAGKKINTSLAENDLSKLWRPFRLQLSQAGIKPVLFYSISDYRDALKNGNFDPYFKFDKWAASDMILEECPLDFEEVIVEDGYYASFNYAQDMGDFGLIMQDFYHKWLPTSRYKLADRSHFETFDAEYDPFDSSSVERIWIPVEIL